MIKDVKKILNAQPYRLKIMGCIIFAEVLMLSLVLFWPIHKKPDNPFQDIQVSESEITLEDVQITTQSGSPPPPPTPQVPVPVPNDRIIEDQPIILNDLNLQQELSDRIGTGGLGGSDNTNQVSANPQQPPSVVRIVEPTVPEAAKKADIKAEIWVSFLVDEEGKVVEATISEIRLYDKDGKSYQTEDHIGYGLTEATIDAALHWRFRPAKNDGKNVRAYTKHIFTYGF